MNYYNPYFYSMPLNIVNNTEKVGLLTRLFGRSGATISGFLNGTQRVLNFANQTIPLVKQVRPMLGNAKTMFKVMNEFKRTEKSNTNEIKKNKTNNTVNLITESKDIIKNKNESIDFEDGPTFFI